MSRRDPLVRVHHVLDSVHEPAAMTQTRSRGDLETDRMRNLSLVRLLEVVGEAAARVPEGFRSQYPGGPWRETTGLRDRLVHGYDTIDFDRLGMGVARFCGKDAPADGINAAAETVGNLELAPRTGISQEIRPHPLSTKSG